jgi:hypothetical protein
MAMIPNQSLDQQVISPRPKRVFLAFLLAPLAGPLGILLGIAPYFILNGDIFGIIGALPFSYIFTGPFVYFFSILLGLPFFLLLRYTGGVTRKALIGGWAVIGVVSFMLLTGQFIPRSLHDILFLIPFALGGAGVGFVFYRVLSSDQENRSNKRRTPLYRPDEDDQSITPSIGEESWP